MTAETPDADAALLPSTAEVSEQLLAIERAFGVRHRPHAGLLAARGKDALDYLHRMLSQDLSRLEVGRASTACVLTPKGKLVGVPTIWRLGSEIWLDLDRRALEPVRERLERTVIAEDLLFEDRSDDVEVLDVVGRGAPAALARHVGKPDDVLRHEALPGGAGRVLRALPFGARPAFVLVVPSTEARALARDLVEAGATAVGETAWDVLRVRARVPAWDRELTPEVMPLEARLGETAVSFSKGCYPGQEPVAMAHHRGRPPHLLVRLAVLGDARPGSAVEEAGRPVGRLATIVEDPADGRRRALGYLRTPLASPGRVLALEGGGTVRVEEPDEAGRGPGKEAR